MARTARTPRPQINTAAYERAHGRKPRGYGTWWFTATDAQTGDVLASISVTANYGEARLLARHRLDATPTVAGRWYDIMVLS